MKKALFFFLFILTIGHLQANISLRNQFQNAVTSRVLAEKLVNYLENKGNLSAIELGYLGATKMVLAKHYINPYSKYDSFKSGRNILENAIKNEPNNSELIYLRYSCAINSPAFLNYHQNLEDDKRFLQNNLKNITDMDLMNRISNFLKK